MFNDFCITSIFTDLSLRKVVIETNFKVDERTVNLETVQFVSCKSGLLENYKLQVEDKNIVLTLNEWPSLEEEYMIKITDIKDLLDRSLNSPVSKKIVFVTDIKSKVKVVKPVDNETLTTNTIEIEIKAISEEEQDLNYRFEISSDVAFFNIVETVVTKELATKVSLKDGQYYLRTRAENEKDCGDWSEVINFLVVANATCECKDKNDDFLDDVLISSDFFMEEKKAPIIIEKTQNGLTDSEFYIILNKNVLFAEPRTDMIEDGTQTEDPAPVPPEEEKPEPPVEDTKPHTDDEEEDTFDPSDFIHLKTIPMYRRDF